MGSRDPDLVRYGQLTSDEFFVSEQAAQAGVWVSNTSETEPLVIIEALRAKQPWKADNRIVGSTMNQGLQTTGPRSGLVQSCYRAAFAVLIRSPRPSASQGNATSQLTDRLPNRRRLRPRVRGGTAIADVPPIVQKYIRCTKTDEWLCACAAAT